MTGPRGQAELGPETALGLPRKLHAAYLKLAKIEKDRSRIIALQYFTGAAAGHSAGVFTI